MKLTSRDKKFLAAGAIAVCLFLVLKFLVFPFYDRFSDQKQEIAVKKRTLEKYLTFIKTQEELQQNLRRSAREERKIGTSLLKGQTTSLAAADIQKIVDTIAEKSEVDIQSVKVMEPEQQEELTKIPVRVVFTSDLSRMSTFISSIETNRKLLTIPELKIRVKNKRKPREISVTLEIAGFMKKE